MRNYLLLTIIVLLGVFLTACQGNASEPVPVEVDEPVEIVEDTTDNEQANPVDELDDNQEATADDNAEKTDDTTAEDTQPKTEEIEDKPDIKEPTPKKEAVKTEKKPDNQADETKKAEDKQKADAKKKADAESEKQAKAKKDAKAKEKKQAEEKAANEKTEAKKKAAAEKNAKEDYKNKSVFDKVIHLTNAERKKVGVAALVKDGNLTKSAQAKSADMKENGSMEHESPEYGGLGGILNRFDVSYSMAGENIAHGQPSAEAVVDAWMKSPDHKANILHPDFTHIGVGYDGNYWTQQFIVKK